MSTYFDNSKSQFLSSGAAQHVVIWLLGRRWGTDQEVGAQLWTFPWAHAGCAKVRKNTVSLRKKNPRGPLAKLAVFRISSPWAGDPHERARRNYRSIRDKQLRRVAALAAFMIRIPRAKKPCDKAGKNKCSFKEKSPAELNSDIFGDAQILRLS